MLVITRIQMQALGEVAIRAFAMRLEQELASAAPMPHQLSKDQVWTWVMEAQQHGFDEAETAEAYCRLCLNYPAEMEAGARPPVVQNILAHPSIEPTDKLQALERFLSRNSSPEAAQS
jgi:hypothetical protein